MTAALVPVGAVRATTRSGGRRPATRVIIENIGLPQALRWHDGCLWFSDQLDDTVYRWRPGGELEVVARVRLANGLGFLPDGRLLIVSTADTCIYRLEADGSLSLHADLAGMAGGPLNDMLTDAAGRAWVGNYGFDYDGAMERMANSRLYAPPGLPTTNLIRIDPDGTTHRVPESVTFPNGSCMVDGGRTMLLCEALSFRIVAMDVFAEGRLGAPREWASLIEAGLWKSLTSGGVRGGVVRTVSTAVDRPAMARYSSSPIAPEALAPAPDGSVYVANAVRGEVVRVAEGGAILQRIPTTGHTAGVLLGGSDGRTLFVATLPTLDPDSSAGHHAGRIEVVHLDDLDRNSPRQEHTVPSSAHAPGKTLAISGGASGIGAATARLAVARGYRVAVCDIDVAAARRLVDQLGSRSMAVALDIRDPHSWEQALDEVEAEWGPLDILINNAGIIRTGYAIDLPIEKHREMIDVNLVGASTGILAGLARMKARGHGHLVTICSMSSFLPLPGYATYAGTKHALRAFHHAVALEERDGPVEFTIIHPTSTQTPMLDQEMADPSSVISFAEDPDTPETVAEAIVKALRTKPAEVVFPAVGGRFQRLMGTQHALIRRILPVVLSTAERNRARVALAKGSR